VVAQFADHDAGRSEGVFLAAAGGDGPFVGRGGPDSDALAVPDERGEKTT